MTSSRQAKMQLLTVVEPPTTHGLVRTFRVISIVRSIFKQAVVTPKFSERTLHLWSVAAGSARLELEQTGSLPSSVFDFD